MEAQTKKIVVEAKFWDDYCCAEAYNPYLSCSLLDYEACASCRGYQKDLVIDYDNGAKPLRCKECKNP